MQVVLITDNADERDYYSYILQQVGLGVLYRPDFEADTAERPSSQSDLFLVISRAPDTIIEDVSRFRAQMEATLFVLVDRPMDSQVAALLEAGADLVLPLPVSPRVLAAYCRNQMQRSGELAAIAPSPLKLGAVELEPSVRSVRVGQRKPQHLTQLEFRMLHLLMTHRGQVITPDVIVDRVWGYAESGSRELVRGLISRVRAKIEPDPNNPRYIRTIAGVGYVFDVE
ncbi:MAG: response regulator transcription factor [Anaerolineales bacterium]|jgi:DNA-binding response OmpR family regulator